MAEGYKDWATGNVLTAADLEDYTVRQSTMRFPTTAARDTALSAIKTDGMMCYITGEDRVYCYDGTNWQRVAHTSSSGRTCLRARRASTVQTIGDGAIADISWDVEDQDTDAFITVPSTTITIPAGLGGLYAISFTVDDAAGGGVVQCARIALSAGATFNFARVSDGTTDRTSGGIVWDVAAGSTVKLAVLNSAASGTTNVTAAISVARVGI